MFCVLASYLQLCVCYSPTCQVIDLASGASIVLDTTLFVDV
jgi:hypothetical protein